MWAMAVFLRPEQPRLLREVSPAPVGHQGQVGAGAAPSGAAANERTLARRPTPDPMGTHRDPSGVVSS